MVVLGEPGSFTKKYKEKGYNKKKGWSVISVVFLQQFLCTEHSCQAEVLQPEVYDQCVWRTSELIEDRILECTG